MFYLVINLSFYNKFINYTFGTKDEARQDIILTMVPQKNIHIIEFPLYFFSMKLGINEKTNEKDMGR